MKGLPIFAAIFFGVGTAQSAGFKPDQLAWSTYADTQEAFIAYAVPESDTGLMWIYCTQASGQITVLADLSTKNLKEGDAFTVTLASEGGRATLAAKAAQDRFGDLQISGILQNPKDLLRLFSKGRTLKASVPGDDLVVPLNRQAHRIFAVFRKSCPILH